MELIQLTIGWIFVKSPVVVSRKFIEHQVFGTNLHHLQAIALALHHAGVDWEGEFPSAWKEMKSKTPFGELPVLEAPANVDLFRDVGRFGVGSIWCFSLVDHGKSCAMYRDPNLPTNGPMVVFSGSRNSPPNHHSG